MSSYTEVEQKNALELFNKYKLAMANLESKKEPGEVIDLYNLYNPPKKEKSSVFKEAPKPLYTKRKSEELNSTYIDKRPFIRCWDDGNCDPFNRGRCPYLHMTSANKKKEPLNVYQQFSKLTQSEIVFILEHSIQVVNYKNGMGFIYKNVMYESLIDLVEDKRIKK
jgi:hypothetical protein